ncbi:MAG: CHAT domain-containing tetratricopeptide repeat protein [Planctomycetota bacterium]
MRLTSTALLCALICAHVYAGGLAQSPAPGLDGSIREARDLVVSLEQNGGAAVDLAHAEVHLATLLWHDYRLDEGERFARRSAERFATAALAGDAFDARLVAASILAEHRPLEGFEEIDGLIEEARSTYGPNSPRTGRAGVALARAYARAYRVSKARSAARQALDALDPEEPDVAGERAMAHIVIALAALYEARAEEAAGLDEHIEVLARAIGADHPSVLWARSAATQREVLAGETARAIELRGEIRETRERIFGPDHPDVAISLWTVGMERVQQARYAEASAILEKADSVFASRGLQKNIHRAALLVDLAELRILTDRLDEAGAALDDAELVLAEQLGPSSEMLCDLLQTRAQLLRSRARFGAAIDVAKRCVAMREECWGSESIWTANALSTLAALYQNVGRNEDARPLIAQVFEIRSAVFGEASVAAANSLNDLALLEQRLGNSRTALELYEQALEFYLEQSLPEDHPNCATVLTNMSWALLSLGEYDAAHAAAREATHARVARMGAKNMQIFDNWLVLANLATIAGRYDEALQHCESARTLLEAARELGHPDYARIDISSAMIRRHMGDLVGAFDDATQAIALRESFFGPDAPRVAEAYLVRGYILLARGKTEEAERDGERALEIHLAADGPDGYATTYSLDLLGRVAIERGRLDRAESYFTRARDVRLRYSPRSLDTLVVRSNAASVLAYRGRFDEAIAEVEVIDAALEDAFDFYHPERVLALVKQAQIHMWKGDEDLARETFARAQPIVERIFGPENSTAVKATRNHATFHLAAGDIDSAWDLIARALGASEVRLRRLLSWTSEVDAILHATEERHALQEMLLILDAAPSPAREEAAYAWFLRWKGHVFRGGAARREQLAASLEPDVRAKLDELRSVQTALSTMLTVRDVPHPDAHQEALDDLRKRRDRLETRVMRSVESTGEEREVRPRELARRLPADAVLVDFFVHDSFEVSAISEGLGRNPVRPVGQRVTAWVLRPGAEAAVRIDLGPSGPIRDAVSAHLTVVSSDRGLGSASEEEVDEADPRVHDLVWKPLVPHVGEARTVYVSPDSFLANLPFETVLAGDRYLIEDRAFVYLQSALSLVRPAAPDDEDGADDAPSFLAVGAIEYWNEDDEESDPVTPRTRGMADLGPWVNLTETRREVDELESLHERTFEGGGRTVLREAVPTEERLKEELGAYDIVHLATHGFFAGEDVPSLASTGADGPALHASDARFSERLVAGYLPGLLAGVVCAAANVGGSANDNGLLTGEEVSWIDLRGCDLVVLSACQTGLGSARSGEGLMSLRRSFHQAGARTVVSSMWKVRDDETVRLMKRFYAEMWVGGLSKGDALRQAQLWMLARNRGRYGRGMPFTWGAFVLSGRAD